MSGKPIRVRDTGGDVIGVGLEGSGHIVAKSVTIGKVIQVVNLSPEAIAKLDRIKAIPTVVSPGNPGESKGGAEPQDLANLQSGINELLTLFKSTASPGQQPREIQAGEVNLSRVDLLLKKAILLKTEADQMYLTHIEKMKPQIDQVRQHAGGGNFQLDLNALLKDFDSGKHMGRLRESYELLQEANELDPANTEVLLAMAQLLIELTPDDPNDERRLLYRVQNLLGSPRDDAERFRLAQTTFLLATTCDPIHRESLRDARQMFEKLGRNEWVRQCDILLASPNATPSTPSVHAGYAGPASVPPHPMETPPPLQTQAFQPVGRWQFQITDAYRSVMIVDFYPNGVFNAVQQIGQFSPGAQAQGQWLFNPYNQMLQMYGMIGGIQPFQLGIVIQGPQPNGFRGIGSDNYSYFMTRLN